MYIYVCMYVCMHVCMYGCMYPCMYLPVEQFVCGQVSHVRQFFDSRVNHCNSDGKAPHFLILEAFLSQGIVDRHELSPTEQNGLSQPSLKRLTCICEPIKTNNLLIVRDRDYSCQNAP